MIPTKKVCDIRNIIKPKDILKEALLYKDFGYKVYFDNKAFVVPKRSKRFYDVVPPILNGVYIYL